MLYFLFFFLSISSLIICDQLQFVTEVFRHGARAPTKNEAQYTHYNFPGLKYGELSYPGFLYNLPLIYIIYPPIVSVSIIFLVMNYVKITSQIKISYQLHLILRSSIFVILFLF